MAENIAENWIPYMSISIMNTVGPGLSDTDLSENLIQQSFIEHNYISPMSYVFIYLWTLTYPTPDLSDIL